MRDAVVIGAGLAGLAASIRLAQRGAQVTLVTKGIGGLQLGQGTIDALGYAPELVERPLDAITQLAADHPTHPYARLGASCVEQSLARWRLFGDACSRRQGRGRSPSDA